MTTPTADSGILCADWFGGICDTTGFWGGWGADMVVGAILAIGLLFAVAYAWANLKWWWSTR